MALGLPAAAAVDGDASSATAATKCPLKAPEAPMVYGFRLGMNLDQVLTRFKDFPELSALTRNASTVLNLNDRAARPAVRGVRSQSGVIEIEVYTPYLATRHAGKHEVLKGGHLYLLVRNGKLAIIRLVDAQSDDWRNLDEFMREMSGRYRISGKRLTKQQSTPSPQLPGVSQDFAAKTIDMDCSGYRITFSCVGPPAPPGLCDLWLKAVTRDAR
jgi:hypothetical protein